LTGQAAATRERSPYHYYRHALEASKKCPLNPKPTVPAQRIEEMVISQLFDTFGNPAAIHRAVKTAIPDSDGLGKSRDRLEKELDTIARSRGKVLTLVERDALTLEQAEPQLRALKEREASLRRELEHIETSLEEMPSEQGIQCYVDHFKDAMGATHIRICDDNGDWEYAGGNDIQSYIMMTPEDKRKLVLAVFPPRKIVGKWAGVYVHAVDEGASKYRPKQWSIRIRGRLDFEMVLEAVGPLASPGSGEFGRQNVRQGRPAPRSDY
jgi:hypothetical protein